MRLIVTRPRREAAKWVQDLRGAGWEALALPLIEIGPVSDVRPVARAWSMAGNCAALMFVSANAVRYFFEEKPAESLVFSDDIAIKTRAWTTGPGTAAALRAVGVSPHLIDCPDPQSPQLDSEALWQVVGPQVAEGERVLIVRGRDRDRAIPDAPDTGVGREWLAQQLRGAGARPEFVVAYERGLPVLTTADRALAEQACRDGSVWLFSSAEAIANLSACFPEADWTPARAVATHPRIAAAARGLGFGQVKESPPGLSGVLSSIESWQ